jgi:hypothetical protein
MVDNDYIKAIIELNEEFPGANYDDSLKTFISKKKKFTSFISALIINLILFFPLHLINTSFIFEINNFIIPFLIYAAIIVPILVILFFFLDFWIGT